MPQTGPVKGPNQYDSLKMRLSQLRAYTSVLEGGEQKRLAAIERVLDSLQTISQCVARSAALKADISRGYSAPVIWRDEKTNMWRIGFVKEVGYGPAHVLSAYPAGGQTFQTSISRVRHIECQACHDAVLYSSPPIPGGCRFCGLGCHCRDWESVLYHRPSNKTNCSATSYKLPTLV
jgi:hypothetical protein